MAIEKMESMCECFTKHLSVGTAGMKDDNETKEDKLKRVKVSVSLEFILTAARSCRSFR